MTHRHHAHRLNAPRIRHTYREIGERLAGHLECQRCSAREACPAQKVAEYTLGGWPKHCGLTMKLVADPPEAA